FLGEHGIKTDYDCTFSLYLPRKADFYSRMKYDFPVVAISLSDYNQIREMLGYGQISLSENQFTTQWQTISTEEDRDSFLADHDTVMTDAGVLTLSSHSFYEEPMGETLYNSYTDVLYIFPDDVCENLLPVMQNRYIITAENLSYENARELEKDFTDQYPELTSAGVSYGIRLQTLQINSTKASNFILQASLLYCAVVLMVICLTILSLQQLLDADKYEYRFSILRNLGVEQQRIGKLVLKQLGLWFGLPILVAVFVSTIVIAYFIQTISAEISAYIGFGTFMLQIGITVGILTLLLVCYFISTWILFKRSIH
ncbi:MAG TPA: ABC transporter permease, partial [Candidatus Blautia pullicola]|nr:ABC transporter permease [Candidatus Blautia pullicola]